MKSRVATAELRHFAGTGMTCDVVLLLQKSFYFYFTRYIYLNMVNISRCKEHAVQCREEVTAKPYHDQENQYIKQGNYSNYVKHVSDSYKRKD